MRLSLPLLALMLAAFGIGTTEFVITGLLPDVARDLNVAVPRAGLLITGYALGVAFGAPIIAVLLAPVARRPALLGLIGIFIVGNAACALAPTYEALMAARVLTALCHGTFFGIGAVVATQVVPAGQRAQAISLMFSGLTLANVLGVPGGTAIGQWLGWRAAFWAIVPIGLAAAGALALWLPRLPGDAGGRGFRELAVLGRPQVALAMLASALVSAGLFATFTYVTPLLEDIGHWSPHVVTWALLLFGLGITGGMLIGGKLADWGQVRSLVVLLSVLIVSSVVLCLVSASGATWSGIAMIGLLPLWGAAMFGCGPPLMTRVVDHAAGAPTLASALNQSAFNLGNAAGAWVGAAALLRGMSLAGLPLITAALAVGSLATVLVSAWVGLRLRRSRAAPGWGGRAQAP